MHAHIRVVGICFPVAETLIKSNKSMWHFYDAIGNALSTPSINT